MRYATAPIIFLILSVATTTSANAGSFFEEVGKALFGSPATVSSPSKSQPLMVHVRKRPKVRAIAVREKAQAPIRTFQAPIRVDPYADREWFLKDQTLRSGDIVVTVAGPLVLQASKQTGSATDFVSLNQVRTMKQAEQNKLLEAIAQGLQQRHSYEPVAIDPHVLEAIAGASSQPTP